MATRTIVTSQPDVACDVCARRLLRGEQPDVFVGAGRRRIVCELCAPRAAHAGWLRETDSRPVSLPPGRPRRAGSLFERLPAPFKVSVPFRVRRDAEPQRSDAAVNGGVPHRLPGAPATPSAPSAQEGLAPAGDFAAADAGLFATVQAPVPQADASAPRAAAPHAAAPVPRAAASAPDAAAAVLHAAASAPDADAPVPLADAPGPAAGPATVELATPAHAQDPGAPAPEPPLAPAPAAPAGQSETATAAAPALASPYLQQALDVFNASEFPRRVAGVIRALGAPLVTVRSAEHLASVVRIVVAWELCWYRYEVDLSEPVAEALVIAQGTELAELAREERAGNAAAADSGSLALAAGG
ncbi:MAG TPA: hypothetical protein VMD79_09500 [Solirubrobacteraceae bacterium]|nr:hypothetical protein [Solirubrobacteraceae bacterium]